MTIDDAARLFAVPPELVVDWCAAGKIHAKALDGRWQIEADQFSVSMEDLAQFEQTAQRLVALMNLSSRLSV